MIFRQLSRTRLKVNARVFDTVYNTRALLADDDLTHEAKFMTAAAQSEWALMKLFAANLTQLREGRRWNKTELGQHACMDKSMVSRAENPEKNGRSVQLDTLVRFALALNVPVWTLLLPPPLTFRAGDE